MSFEYPEHGINSLVRRYIEGMGDLSGRTVLDCPAGDGRASYLLRRQGASVVAADLFPLRFAVDAMECQTADLARELPFADASFDFAICQEGIEHIQNQLTCLAEFNRVLKPGGTMLVTTPSLSHLRARLSNFLVESDLWKRQAPSELDAVWFVEDKPDEMYYGHLFLLSAQKLRAIAVLSGFEIIRSTANTPPTAKAATPRSEPASAPIWTVAGVARKTAAASIRPLTGAPRRYATAAEPAAVNAPIHQ